jgi:hypothetical protein
MCARLLPLLCVSWHAECDDFATQQRSFCGGGDRDEPEVRNAVMIAAANLI